MKHVGYNAFTIFKWMLYRCNVIVEIMSELNAFFIKRLPPAQVISRQFVFRLAACVSLLFLL